jgi:hypothetical protein
VRALSDFWSSRYRQLVRRSLAEGARCCAVDRHSGGRFRHGKALGGEFGIGAIHEVFALGCLYFVFGMDGMNVIVHPGAVEDEETVRGIRSSEILEL